MCVCVCVCVCLYVYMCVYVCTNVCKLIAHIHSTEADTGLVRTVEDREVHVSKTECNLQGD